MTQAQIDRNRYERKLEAAASAPANPHTWRNKMIEARLAVLAESAPKPLVDGSDEGDEPRPASAASDSSSDESVELRPRCLFRRRSNGEFRRALQNFKVSLQF